MSRPAGLVARQRALLFPARVVVQGLQLHVIGNQRIRRQLIIETRIVECAVVHNHVQSHSRNAFFERLLLAAFMDRTAVPTLSLKNTLNTAYFRRYAQGFFAGEREPASAGIGRRPMTALVLCAANCLRQGSA